MAHFYGGIKGNRGRATRLGTKKSGLVAFLNGWNVGVDVHLDYNPTTKTDEITIYKTSGSNRGRRDNTQLIGVFK